MSVNLQMPLVGHMPIGNDLAPMPHNQGQVGQHPPQGMGQMHVGMGALAGHQIQVGDGQQREAANVHAERAKSFFKAAGKVLVGIVLAPIALPIALAAGSVWGVTSSLLRIPRFINEKVLEPRSDKAFQIAHPELAALRQPMPGSVLNNPGVESRLFEHAKAIKTPMTPQQIQEHVALGERLAQALSDPQVNQHASGSPISVMVHGNAVQVDSSVHTTRALAWYMAASAANQDANRELSQDHATIGGQKVADLTSDGAMVMKDPGNRLYKFLSAAPTADSRMSTHFAERVDHTEKHKIAGFIPSGKPAQRGIEDYRNMLPGQGGTMLFDKLAANQGAEELFVKFEKVGCPPYFKTEPHQGVGQGIARFFCALDRNIGHATNFLGSMKQGRTDEMRRQEHVYKGTPKNDVAKPFADLVKNAVQSGVIDASCSTVGKSVHKFGLPFLREALDSIESAANHHGNQQILQEVAAVREGMMSVVNKLGAQSDQYGIDRRGAETHVSMNLADNVLRPMNGRLEGPKAQRFNQEAAQTPTGLGITTPAEGRVVCQQVALDWPRSTVRVGAQTFDHSPFEQTAQQLSELTGGDQRMTMLVSQYANQQILASLTDAIMRGDLDIRPPNGPQGMPLGEGNTNLDIQADPSGAIRIAVRYTQEQVNYLQTVDERGNAQVINTDPANSHADFSFEVTIAPDYSVSVSQDLRYEALIRTAG